MSTILRILVFTILLSGRIFAQEFSVHKMHMEQFGSIEKKPSLYNESGEGIIPLRYDKAAITGTAIFGYLPDWEYQSNRQYIRYDILTHLAAFDFTVTNTGAISNPSYWPWTDIINTAHANGVKVILTAVNFNASDIHTIMTNATVKQTFFLNVKSRIEQFQLDGVNIDFESLNTADRGTVLNTFMAELKSYLIGFFPNVEVSFAGPALTSGYNVTGLAAACDYIFIMGYAFWGSWSTTSGACAPLTGGSINITNTVLTQYASVTNSNPQKLILGVPYYGLKWVTTTDQPHSSVVSYVSSTRYRDDYALAQTHGHLWAADQQVPWYRYQSNNQWYQVWWDNDSSLGLKYALSQSKNYRGVGMWALGYDGARTELWYELYKRYYLSVPVELTSFYISQENNGIILHWTTSTETNNREFKIERKMDNELSYSTIASLPGAGTATNPRTYIYLEQIGLSGKISYRLIQVDFNGVETVLGEEAINVGVSPAAFEIGNPFPNPFNNSFVINYSDANEGKIDIVIYNVNGKIIQKFDQQISLGAGQLQLQLPDYCASGVYLLKIQQGSRLQFLSVQYLK